LTKFICSNYWYNLKFGVTVMGHLYRYESLIDLSLFLTVSMLPFGCINEMITFSLQKKKKKRERAWF
jgi:hypothetical protein